MERLKDRKRGRSGFTLAETLITVLILLMVSGVVAAGIPSAANALEKAVDGANAQVLLSTTMTILRDELGTAYADSIEIVDSGSGISYTNSEGFGSVIRKGTAGITLNDSLLVSEQAATKGLYATFKSISYAAGVVAVTDLKVMRGENAVVTVPSYLIRVVSYVAEPTSAPGGE